MTHEPPPGRQPQSWPSPTALTTPAPDDQAALQTRNHPPPACGYTWLLRRPGSAQALPRCPAGSSFWRLPTRYLPGRGSCPARLGVNTTPVPASKSRTRRIPRPGRPPGMIETRSASTPNGGDARARTRSSVYALLRPWLGDCRGRGYGDPDVREAGWGGPRPRRCPAPGEPSGSRHSAFPVTRGHG